MQTSPYAEEIRQQERIKERRQATLRVLQSRFPGQVPADVVARIKAETNLAVLDGWLDTAGIAPLESFRPTEQ